VITCEQPESNSATSASANPNCGNPFEATCMAAIIVEFDLPWRALNTRFES
jgi:hypothetical protein